MRLSDGALNLLAAEVRQLRVVQRLERALGQLIADEMDSYELSGKDLQ